MITRTKKYSSKFDKEIRKYDSPLAKIPPLKVTIRKKPFKTMVRKHSARGEMLGSARGWKKIHIKENPPYFFSI